MNLMISITEEVGLKSPKITPWPDQREPFRDPGKVINQVYALFCRTLFELETSARALERELHTTILSSDMRFGRCEEATPERRVNTF
jgi:hypothetical protein